MQRRLCDEAPLVASLYTATRCAAVWRGTAGALGSVRCGVDGVGSARQAFVMASAFNQNIGSWNTASVTTMSSVRALLLLHACGLLPQSFSQQWSRRKWSPAQMWGRPTSDVGESRRRCGRVPAQMWVRLGSPVRSLVYSIYKCDMVACCNDAVQRGTTCCIVVYCKRDV